MALPKVLLTGATGYMYVSDLTHNQPTTLTKPEAAAFSTPS